MHHKKLTPILIIIMITTVISSLFSACSNKNSNPTETDVGEITFYRTEMEHIVADTDGSMYVDNEILIVANADASYSDIENIAKGIGAEIVGWIEQTGDYQLKLNQTYTEDQLNELIDSLNKNQFVDSAYINFASQIDSTKTEERNGFYFGNEWKNDLQIFNNCKGDSWGIEAIEVLAAWDILDMYKRNVNPVKVGLIDSAFDTSHEDLGFAETFYNVDSRRDHGTHVAGTMAAKTDNREGICGVYPYGNSNLYGVSYSGICNFSENGSPITTSMFLKIAYAELILRDVKVINSSLGFNYYQWPLSYSDPEWDDQVAFLESNAYVLGDFLDRLLDKGYDFVLVNAAGNDSDRSSGVVYESKYNFWTTVISKEEYPNVYDRIIVVGAVNSDYEICNFSNGGNRVDIFAPGDTIFSTTPNNNYANKNWSGTSMAAPHVSGVAAIVWSVNNELTGAQVKEIVCSSHSFRCTSCNMVDAYVAMRKATHTYDTTDSTTPVNGAILCWVVSAEDDDTKIENAAVTVRNTQTGEEFSTTTDSMGHFEIFVPAGTYTLVVKAEGYEDFAWPNEDEPYTNPISVDNENVNYLDDWIKMSPNSVAIKDNGMFFLTERPSTDRPGLFTFKEFDLEGYAYETDRGGYTIESFCPSNLNVVANFVGDFTHSGKNTDFTVQKAWDDYYCVEKLCLQIEGVINAYVNDLSMYNDKEVYYYIVDGIDTAYLVCEKVEYDNFSASNGKYYYKTGTDSGKDITESITIINMSNYTKHTITVDYNTEYLYASYTEKIEEFMGDSKTNYLFYAGYSNEGQFSNYDDVVVYIKNALSPYGLADRVLSDSSSLSNYTPVFTTTVIGEPKSGSVGNYEDAQIRGKGIVGFPTYTGTWFPDGVVKGPATPSEDDSAGSDPSDKYQAFLANRGYLPDWTSSDISSFYTLGSYSLIDIDQNGTEELIIVSNSDIGFLAFLVYTIDEETGEIVRLPAARSDVENNILSCYGDLRYSPKYKALVFSETKPTAMYGGVEYFVVTGDCLYSIGTVGVDSFITEGEMTYYSTLSGSFEEITEETRDSYLSELQWLEYSPLP